MRPEITIAIVFWRERKKICMMTTLVSMTAFWPICCWLSAVYVPFVELAIWRLTYFFFFFNFNPDGKSHILHQWLTFILHTFPNAFRFAYFDWTRGKARKKWTDVRNNTSSHHHFNAIIRISYTNKSVKLTSIESLTTTKWHRSQ